MASALVVIGINLLLSAALWGIGMLLRKKQHTEGPRLESREVQISTYGETKPILYGRCKAAMALIWATKLRERKITHEVGKGGGGSTTTEYKYSCSWAGMFGIAPDIATFGELQLLKLWIDSKLVFNATADNDKVVSASAMKKFKFYSGSATQSPDSVIETALGSGDVPAYRYRCYGRFKDLDLTPYGNRIPTIRALVSPGTVTSPGMYPVIGVVQLEDGGWPINSLDDAGVIMSVDEQWIILGYYWSDEEYNPCFTWHKISTAKRMSITNRTYYYPDPNCSPFDVPFYHFQGFDVDELNFVYVVTCDGYGYVVKLDSDTFTIQVTGPEEFSIGQIERIKVSRNPSYPYLWSWLTSVAWWEDAVWLHHRDTLANPFDSNDYGYEFNPPEFGGSLQAGAVNHANGSFMALWGYSDPLKVYFSRIYPNGTREDTDITAQLDGLTAESNLRDHLCYDPDSNQIIIASTYSVGDDLLWILDADTLTQNYKITNCGPYYGNSVVDFDRGVVNGYFYMLRADDILKININTGTIEETYDTSALLDFGIHIEGIMFCNYKKSIFAMIRDSGVDMQELILERLTPGSVVLEDVVVDVCKRAGMSDSQLNAAQLTDEVKGYLVAQDQSARESLEPLMEAFIFDGVEIDGVLTFIKRGGASVATIPEADLAAFMAGSDRPEPLEIESKDEITELPRRLEVHYPNIDRNHEAGIQHYQRQVTDSKLIKKIQTPVLMDDDDAKQLSHIAFKYDWETQVVRLSLGPKYSRLTPLDVVTVQKSEGDYRVLLLDCKRQGLLTNWTGIVENIEYTSTIGGNPGPDIDEDVDFPGPSIYYLLDTPPLMDNHDQAAVYVASGALFEDWVGCSIYNSKDNGETWQYFVSTPERAMTGVVTSPLDDHEFVVRDRHSSMTVKWDYSDDALASVTESQLLQGQGHYLALIKQNGDIEVVCAKTVVTNGDSTQTFTDFIRGVKGTEHARTTHLAGEKVIRLNTATVFLKSLDATYLNQSYLYNGISSGDEWDSGVKRMYTTNLNTLKPWSGVQPVGTRDGSNNLTITWRRRNRIYGLNPYFTGNEVPMSEDSESYEVDILDGDDVVRTISSLTSESASYSAADQTTDGFTPGDPISCNIYQLSDVVGRGWPLEAVV